LLLPLDEFNDLAAQQGKRDAPLVEGDIGYWRDDGSSP
jgi:hypothetical protein